MQSRVQYIQSKLENCVRALVWACVCECVWVRCACVCARAICVCACEKRHLCDCVVEGGAAPAVNDGDVRTGIC